MDLNMSPIVQWMIDYSKGCVVKQYIKAYTRVVKTLHLYFLNTQPTPSHHSKTSTKTVHLLSKGEFHVNSICEKAKDQSSIASSRKLSACMLSYLIYQNDIYRFDFYGNTSTAS